MARRTPGPWVAHFFERNKRTHAGDWCFMPIGGFPLLQNGKRSEKDAEFIVRACNAHPMTHEDIADRFIAVACIIAIILWIIL